MKNIYPKGSEWCKWDMHIHSPESILYNEFGKNWDTYVTNLFKAAIRENVIAIGITDYFFIDGYKKVRNEYLSNESKLAELFSDDEILKIKNILVIPNLEFRINKLIISNQIDLKWNRKVNFHVIFSNDIDPLIIEENFLNQLQFENYGVAEGSPQKLNLTKRNLTELGSRLKTEHSEFSQKSDLEIGLLCSAVDDNDIVKILNSQNSAFKGKYLLALPTDEDLSAVSWNSQGHLSRKVLFQKSHLLFSSNQSTIDFGLGRKHSNPVEFINEFGSLKPCIWGSDAHSFDDLFIPDLDRYTWIKANPTFEGLKQVVYEPEDRVRIQQNIPDQKTPYLVIDKVCFIDKTGNKTFQPYWIELNQNLNTIIGGKSSGKSLLLYHIGKSIDPDQVELKTNLIEGDNYNIFYSKNFFDFEVIWKNGDKDTLSQSTKSSSQITYIPQMYINHLAEENGEQQLAGLIESILKQNSDYKNFIEKSEKSIQECKTRINYSIDERLIQIASFKKLNAEKNKIGNKEKITIEIKRLGAEIDKLRKESGFNEIQNNLYKKLARSIVSIQRYKANSLKTIESLESYKLFINNQLEIFNNNSDNKLLELEPRSLERVIINRISSRVKSELSESSLKLLTELNKIIKKLQHKITQYETRLTKISEKIKPLQQIVKNQELLTRLEKDQKFQNDQLILLDKFDKEINGVIEKGKQARKDIFEQYTKLFEYYKLINMELGKPIYGKIDTEIELNSNLIFDERRFLNFTDLFDNRTRLNSVFVRVFRDDNSFIYEEKTHVDTINSIFTELKNGENPKIKLKSNIRIDDLYYKLFDDYFRIGYKIIYKGDNIIQMSPGKRGLVLLQLLLHISNASHPILIDQPEDNLDNRTVYDELKQFIKNKKIQRQIIIATHNANLVVSTDSENIIIANQSGQQIGKDKKEYVFEYISGALENTFIDLSQQGILFKYGIKEHVCDILEGGRDAFQKREQKYGFR